MERILARVALRSARPRDLTALRSSLAALPVLRRALAALEAPLLAELTQRSAEHVEVAALLARSIAAEPAAQLRDGDVIAGGYDEELDELRRIATHTDDFLLELEGRERARTGLAGLKLGYNRVQGFYIEVSRRDAERVPRDYVRRQTVKSAERFITEELKDFEDRVLGAREKALARERELYEALLTRLGEELAPLQSTAAALAELDALAALAERAASLQWSEPELTHEARLAITGGRHPVVERFSSAPFVPNDLVPRGRAAHAHHHRPQHGRQIHLHAPGGAHRAARPGRQLRAGRAARSSASSTASSPASAPATTWPAAARPSWWR